MYIVGHTKAHNFLEHFLKVSEQGFSKINLIQEELITKSLQLPHFPVTTYSQTNIFLNVNVVPRSTMNTNGLIEN